MQQRLAVDTVEQHQQELEQHERAACLANQAGPVGDDAEETGDALEPAAGAGWHKQRRQLQHIPHQGRSRVGAPQQLSRPPRGVGDDRSAVCQLAELARGLRLADPPFELPDDRLPAECQRRELARSGRGQNKASQVRFSRTLGADRADHGC